MKTFKEFQTVIEGYKEPNIERMQRQAEKHSKDLKSGKEHYSREARATRGDMENIYKGKKNTEIYRNKPRGYSDRYTRHPDPNDLMSQQLALKHTKKVNVDQPQRRAQNIRAKIQQHQNDPLGYMSRTFGGPHIDTGMDMKRRPTKKKVQEAYKEPNVERMKRQAGWHLSTNHIDLSREIDRLSRGKKIDSTIGYPDKPIYFRDKEGIPRRNVRHDVASFRGLENYLNKQNANRVRKGKNIQAKIQQYHNDPLGYMSKSFGGPHIDTGMDMKRRPRKKVNEGYKEPNVERMRLKAQYHNNMAGTLGYAMNPLNREKQNLYRGRKNFVSRYDSNAPKAYHRDNKTGKVQRGADINDLESIHRYEKRQSKLLKNRFDRHSRSAKNIQAKIDQHQNDPLSYMSRAMGGPHADDNMDMKRRPTKKKVQEAYKEPNLPKMEKQLERHATKAGAVYRRYSHAMNMPPSAHERMKTHENRARKIYDQMKKYKEKNPEIHALYKSLGMIKQN